MDCPTCNSAMIDGEISLEISLADLVLGSAAFSTLVFRAPGTESVTIMNEADSYPAARCAACGYFTIITDPEFTDTHCLVCKSLMPAGTASCPKCGWTYKES